MPVAFSLIALYTLTPAGPTFPRERRLAPLDGLAIVEPGNEEAALAAVECERAVTAALLTDTSWW
jgi:hypothetical protein